MNKLKLMVAATLTSLFMLGNSIHATAQDKDGNKEKVEKVKKELGLSDEQSSKIKSINQDIKQRMDNLRDDKTLDRTAKRERMHDLQKERKQRLRDVLTREQRDKFRDMRESRRDDMDRRDEHRLKERGGRRK